MWRGVERLKHAEMDKVRKGLSALGFEAVAERDEFSVFRCRAGWPRSVQRPAARGHHRSPYRGSDVASDHRLGRRKHGIPERAQGGHRASR